jgi:hypothetical protein
MLPLRASPPDALKRGRAMIKNRQFSASVRKNVAPAAVPRAIFFSLRTKLRPKVLHIWHM